MVIKLIVNGIKDYGTAEYDKPSDDLNAFIEMVGKVPEERLRHGDDQHLYSKNNSRQVRIESLRCEEEGKKRFKSTKRKIRSHIDKSCSRSRHGKRRLQNLT